MILNHLVHSVLASDLQIIPFTSLATRNLLFLHQNWDSSLVNLGLRQAGDLLSTILDLSVGGLESAQNTGTLLDSVVTGQLVVSNAVEGTVAW